MKKTSTPYKNMDRNIEKKDTIIVVPCKSSHLGHVIQ